MFKKITKKTIAVLLVTFIVCGLLQGLNVGVEYVYAATLTGGPITNMKEITQSPQDIQLYCGLSDPAGDYAFFKFTSNKTGACTIKLSNANTFEYVIANDADFMTGPDAGNPKSAATTDLDYTFNVVLGNTYYLMLNASSVDFIAPLWISALDITAPIIISTSVDTIAGTTANANITANETGTAYYVVQPQGAAEPANVQVLAGQDGGGIAAAVKGNSPITANDQCTFNMIGLNSQTPYTVYVVAVDGAGNKSNVVSQEFTTTDITAPTISSTSVDTIAETTANTNITANEAGTAYYVVQPQGAGAPSNTQVVAGENGGGTAAVVKGNNPIAANDQYTFNMIGLNSNTPYTVYIVAVDGSGNKSNVASQNFVTIDTTPPTVTAGNISINGATGTGDAYKVGDTVTATWNNTAGGDNNNDISVVTVDFSQFGGGAAVAGTSSAGTWTATYTIVTGAIDGTNRNVSVTATDNAGNTTTRADDTNAAVDNVVPTVTASRIEISGATGTDGAYKFGDIVTVTWNNTAGGDNNIDTISGVTVDFSQFGGGAATAATNTSGTWSATYTIVAGAIDTTNRNVSVTATDNSGNATTMADDTNATLDSVAPIVTTAKISISGATGTGGSYKLGNTVTATWNNTAAGDNNSDISAVTVNFSQFGGGTVLATNSSGTWSATYTILAGAIDSTNRNVIVTATDDAGNSKVLAGNTNADLDNVAPTVMAGNISISGATGTGGVYKLGDTVTATWDNTAGGDNNSDTIVGVTVDFSQFGGGTAVAATNLGGIRTATYTIVAGTIEATNRKVSVKATDNAGNFTVAVDDTNATVDNQAPSVTTLSPADGANNIGVSSNLIITFNNDIANDIGNINIFDSDDNLIEVIDVTSGKVTVSDNIVTINPAFTLLFNTNYYVQIDNTAFKDTSGNSYAGISDKTSWNFTTTLSTNADLSYMELSSGSLSPVFESGKLTYTADVSNAVSSITVTPTVADNTATVTVYGVAVTSGTASGAISLSVGGNTITVVVTAASGATNAYTVTVTRAASSNADLSNLILSSGSLSPAFASGTSTYTASVSNAVNSITVTPTRADSTATLTVNGVAVTSGNPTGIISLSVGSNTITVLVTAASGATNTYTVTVTRAASSNADLNGLTLSSGSLSPAFASGTLTYTASVSNAVSSITATPTTADGTATVTVNGATVTSGTSSGAISLSVGSNTITVLVTAASGATNTYTLTVTRDPSSNANLSGLLLSNGYLDSEFQSGKLTYTASVTYGVNSITVTPTTADDTAAVTVNGVAVTNGTSSGAISLSVGSNTITVLVTAASGATNTYTVTVTRAVIAVPNIVGNPSNATVTAGNTATFTVVATVSDSGTLTYQWQKSTDNGSNWSDIGIGEATAISSGYTTGALATGDSGNQYRCVVTNTNNSTTATAISSAATVVVNANETSSSPQTNTTPPGNVGKDILINGVKQTVATSETIKVDDKTTTTITIDDKKIDELLKNEGNNFTVTIPVNNNSDMVIGQLNGQTAKNMETKEAVLEIKTENATYTLPAAQINIDSVSSQMGEKVLLKDIVVSVSIANSSDNIARIVEDTANKNHYQILVKPLDFEISCTSGGKAVDVSHFNGYVERTIAIPDGIDPSKITTGIVLNEDGTFSHVPTQIISINGKYYAKINSLTNSTYSVLFNPIEFKDVEKHWAKDAINDMGSRLVVSGIGDGTFEPNRSITRGEFASILVKALGLRPETVENSFSDVKSTDWYSGFVETAYKYGIISGYGNGKFGAKDEITREQAMNMVAKAMKITGLKVDFKAGEIESLLAGYIDSSNAASWASSSIASCVKAGIISGNSQKQLTPKDNITRAEVSVIVRKLLQKSNLIN